jgi:DNA-binding NarL/FixJ family response regulator
MREEDHISVLLIDSRNTDRNYYADRLKISSSEYVIFQAASGKTGISVYETVEIDCVVLEIDLADMSGFEVLVQLVPTRPPKVPVIILTRLTNPFILDLAVKNGALASLYKSSTPGDILDKTILRAVSTIQRHRKKETVTSSVQLELLEDSLAGSPASIRHEPFSPASLLGARSQSA